MSGKSFSKLRRRGQSLVEFTFVGIPLIFILVSVFEVSRGMWLYHTLAHSVRDGVRFSIVHGYNCGNNGNTCSMTMQDVATVIRNAGVGLDQANTKLNFYSFTTDSSAKTAVGSQCTFSTCSSGTLFPPASCNTVRLCRVEIDIQTPFNSAISMFWPGSKRVSFANGTLGASSADAIQY